MRKGIFYQLTTFFLNIIILIIVMKKYNTVDSANYFLMISTYSVFRLFLDYSFSTTGIRDIKEKKLELYYFDVFVVKIFIAIAIVSILYIYWMITDSKFSNVLYFNEIFLIAFLNSLLDIHWIVYLKNLIVKYYKLYSILKLIFLIDILLVKYDIVMIVMINIIIESFVGIWLTIVVMKNIDSLKFVPNGIMVHLKNGLLSGYKNFFSLSLISIITSSWIFLVNMYSNNMVVIIYGLVEKITRFSISFFTPLFNYMINGQTAKILDGNSSKLILFLLLTVPSLASYLILNNTNFELFANKGFYEYITEIVIMLMVIPFYYFNGYCLTKSIIMKTEITSLSFYIFSLILLSFIFLMSENVSVHYLPLSLEVIVLMINILFYRKISNEKTY